MKVQQAQPHFDLNEEIPHPEAQSNDHENNSDNELAAQPELYSQARNQFIFKVYSILGMQLFLTTMVVVVAMMVPEFAAFQRHHYGLSIFAIFVVMGTLIALMCKTSLAETFPINMILLAVFTLAESYVVSSICILYQAESVLLAAGVTAASTIGITLYAKFSKSGFSTFKQMLGAFGSSVISAILFITFVNFFLAIPILSSLIAFTLCIVYSLYMLYDTLMIMDNVKHNISLDQYVLAAIFLYVDIIGLFLNILKLLGNRRSN